MKDTNDPLERLVSKTLDVLGIEYSCPDQEKWSKGKGSRLDFYLPTYGLYIECKAYGTSRIHPQVENVDNCIILIGICATSLFCNALKALYQNTLRA